MIVNGHAVINVLNLIGMLCIMHENHCTQHFLVFRLVMLCTGLIIYSTVKK